MLALKRARQAFDAYVGQEGDWTSDEEEAEKGPRF
jgi:hypothetical protein